MPEPMLELSPDRPIDQALHTAPVIYLDGAAQFIANDTMVKVCLYQELPISPPGGEKVPVARVVCARLVMTPFVLSQLADWLTKQSVGLQEVLGQRKP